mmetsp:Transcript_62811/g.134885  ORF Transcript_62811/g.134885 Transcript_62811/m.134885 type:complete len:203 (+) Transcript_62811:917-1525(+)
MAWINQPAAFPSTTTLSSASLPLGALSFRLPAACAFGAVTFVFCDAFLAASCDCPLGFFTFRALALPLCATVFFALDDFPFFTSLPASAALIVSSTSMTGAAVWRFLVFGNLGSFGGRGGLRAATSRPLIRFNNAFASGITRSDAVELAFTLSSPSLLATCEVDGVAKPGLINCVRSSRIASRLLARPGQPCSWTFRKSAIS